MTETLVGQLGLAVVGGIFAVIVAVVQHKQGTKIQEIHVLVNSKMTEALEKIAALELRLAAVPGTPENAAVGVVLAEVEKQP